MPAPKYRLVAAALLLAAVSSHALTLGRVRGAALIGRALDVSVPVQVEAGETLGPNCFEADVFHGDVRQDGSRVRLSTQPLPAGGGFNLHISSGAVVDEPIVTVYVRVACGLQMSRRYVLLADVVADQPSAPAIPVGEVPLVVPAPAAPAAGGAAQGAASSGPAGGSEVASAAAGSMAAAPVQPPAAARPPAVRARPAPAAQRSRPPAAAAAPRAPAQRAPSAPAPAPAAVADPKPQAGGRDAGQSRLRLDQLDVLAERVATLESTTANQPAEAVARASREAERVASMEANIQRLLALAANNEAGMRDLRARLEDAEAQRYANPVVYGLGLVALLLLVACLLLLRRQRQGGESAGSNWWSNSQQGADTVVPPQPPVSPSQRADLQGMSEPVPLSVPGVLSGGDAAAATVRTAPPRTAPAPITQVDVSLVEMSESTFDRLMQSDLSHSAVRKPRPQAPAEATVPLVTTVPRSPRSINSEELFDIRQQAEFFVSLGQTDQAVRILENRIARSGETSPLAYLDLLKIFHSLGLRADFRQLREDFGQLFNATVPEFASFDDEGRDLEAYPAVLAQIESEWGTPSVFTAIEGNLFKGQWNAGSEPFDLAAFRDLLLLHAVAQWSLSPSESLPSPLMPASPGSTEARIAAASNFAGLDTEGLERPSRQDEDDPLPTIDGSADLDIDLSDLYGEQQQPQRAASPAGAAAQDSPDDEPTGGNLIDFDLSGLEFKDPKAPRGDAS